jgi:predicted secreted hydrolase
MRLLLAACLLALCGPAAAEWRVAEPGWTYEFPRDHGNHPGFRTEWWYFTGNLRAQDGREFGYQLTFFRQGVGHGEDRIPLSRFVTRDIKFAHFAVTDLAAGRFHFFQKISRGAYGDAGFGRNGRLAWIEDWSCEGGETFTLRASEGDVAVELTLRPRKPPVIHGEDGISRKGGGAGQASHYYSLTRMETAGVIRLGRETIPVSGESWFDHEWATNQLGENQVGWDWFSLQLDDGGELMLFQLRTRGGGRDPHSAGTFVDADGRVTPLDSAAFILEPTAFWKSAGTGAEYPTAWRMEVKALDLKLAVRAAQENQELLLQPITYWEGAVRATGSRGGRAVSGQGYLEMTGYATPVRGMQEGR